jgi:hypothetical protein
MSQTERNLKRPFEYKIPSKEEAKSSEPIVVEEED